MEAGALGREAKKLTEIARRLIEGAPDTRAISDALAAFGLVADGPVVEAQWIEVWPEHWQSMEVFAAMGSQIRTAGIGALGYHYEALPFVMDTLGVAAEARRQVFEDFRIMEAEAVRLLNARRG